LPRHELSTLSLPDALPIWTHRDAVAAVHAGGVGEDDVVLGRDVSIEAAAGNGDRERVLMVRAAGLDALVTEDALRVVAHVQLVVDRKSTRLNSSHLGISYA